MTKITTIIVAAMLLTGCAHIKYGFGEANKMFTCKLRYGMTEQELFDSCGRGRVKTRIGGFRTIELKGVTGKPYWVFLDRGRVVGVRR